MPGIYKSSNFIDRPVLSDRCGFTIANLGSTGTGSQIAMFNHTFLRNATDLVLVYTNPTSATLTQQAWINVGGGATQLTFNGQTTVTIPPYGCAKTDAFSFTSTAGNTFQSYTATQSSGSWANTIATEPSLGDSSASSGGTTPLTPSAISGTTNVWARGPTAILGTTATCTEPTVISIGTSISEGDGDIYDNCFGFLRRAFEPFAQMGGAGLINCSIPGAGVATYAPMLSSLLPTLFSGCHWLYDEIGANEVGVGYANNTWLASLSPLHTCAKMAGLKIARQVLSPRTDFSPDTNITDARQVVNPWLRGGLLDADLVVEWNSVVETGTDTNVWSNTAFTNTGTSSAVHLSPTGAAAVAAYLTGTYLVLGKFNVNYREWTAAQSTSRPASLSQGNFAA